MRARNYYIKKFRKRRHPHDWERFCKLKRDVKESLTKAKRDHFEVVCKNLGNKPKKVWSELNKALGRNTNKSITHLTVGTSTITSIPLIAEKLNNHFSTCAAPTTSLQCLPIAQRTDSIFQFEQTTEQQVTKALKKSWMYTKPRGLMTSQHTYLVWWRVGFHPVYLSCLTTA